MTEILQLFLGAAGQRWRVNQDLGMHLHLQARMMLHAAQNTTTTQHPGSQKARFHASKKLAGRACVRWMHMLAHRFLPSMAVCSPFTTLIAARRTPHAPTTAAMPST
jgi:hypothetical protein